MAGSHPEGPPQWGGHVPAVPQAQQGLLRIRHRVTGSGSLCRPGYSESVRARVRGAGDTPAAIPVSPVLTKGTDELGLDCPGDSFYQAQRGEPRKAHVVEEDDVKVPQPVEAAKIPQEVKTGDPCTGVG